MKNKIYLSALFLLLLSCNTQDKPAISFYYWRTIFKLSTSEKTTLSENKVKKLYIRYLDIDLNPKSNKPFPESPIRFEQKPTGFLIVPVIYIKNKVMLHENFDSQDLAQKVNNFVKQINTINHISCQEIQVDCDWTLNSKDNYLKFIDCFKKISNKKLSATIRLHQIKYYRETKIPNVDYGVLMYYNMGKIAPDSLNSIYDKHVAQKYLNSITKYPLSINVALPIYSWAIHIRGNNVLGLKSKINISDIKKNSNFVQTKNNYFQVKRNNYNRGTFYKTNDLLKFEKITADDLLEMADDLKENIPNKPHEIIFYDLDEFNTQQYEKGIFTKIINRF